MRWAAIALVALWGCSGSRIPVAGDLGAEAADAEQPGDPAGLDPVGGEDPDEAPLPGGVVPGSLPGADLPTTGGLPGTVEAPSTRGELPGGLPSGAPARPGPQGAPRAGDPATDPPPPEDPPCDPAVDPACACEAVSCDDGNPCTADTCEAGACAYAAVDAPCDDGDACTAGEHCADGACVSGALVTCDDGNPCTADVCDAATGCAPKPLPNGAKCGPAAGCTDHVCVAGACTQAPRSCDDGEPCTDDACDEAAGCVHTIAAGQPGCCAASAECDDANPCTSDVCDGAGACVYGATAGPCDDGNACTTGDQCAGGDCAGAPADCDDGAVCTVDACHVVIGCLHAPAQDGLPCADGDPCIEHACAGGSCLAAPVDCDDGNPCTADWCGAGACQHDPVGDALAGCCTVDAHCDDGDVCTADACDEALHQCDHAPELGAYLDERFDGAPAVELWSSNDAVGFALSEDRFVSAPASLYLGSPVTKTYDAGKVHATATLPPIAVPAAGKPVLGFWLWQDVADKDCTHDALTVLVDGAAVLEQCTGTKGWVPRTVDLAAYAGGTVTITFDFDTRDASDNAAEGVYIDDVILLDAAASAASCCTTDADCSGAALCTNEGGVCLPP